MPDGLRGRRRGGRQHGQRDDAGGRARGTHRVRECAAPHGHGRAVGLPRQLDLHGVADVAVPERVGEGLLHDPVDGELLAGAELAGAPGLDELDGEARGAHLVDQVAQLLELRLRGVVLAVAELREEDAHVAERLPGGRGDGAERLVGGVRIHHAGVAGAVGLRDDDGERVRDHVVHVARDAVALLLDDHVVERPRLVPLGRLLGVPALVRRPGGDDEAARGPGGEQHAPRAEEEEEEQRGEVGPLPRAEREAADGDAARRVGEVERRDHAADDGGREAEGAGDAAAVGGAAVDDARDRDVAGLDAGPCAHLHDRAGPGDRERQPGRQAADGQRRAHDEHEDQRDLGGREREDPERAGGRDADGAGRQQGDERDREDDVEDDLVPRDPAQHGTTVRAARRPQVAAGRGSPRRRPDLIRAMYGRAARRVRSRGGRAASGRAASPWRSSRAATGTRASRRAARSARAPPGPRA
ncbi:hypothetical protein BFL35_06680 [Clavibacter michiganensis]|nr:hypothetical protein BFL35_06680 [Clavibacter michiganensis]